MNHLIAIQYCYDYLVNQISIGLLLYSHIPTALVALFFGGFLLYKKRKLPSVMLFIVCASFAAWAFLDITSWFAFLGSGVMMFTWSLADLFALIFFFFSYYFLYTFSTGSDLPLWQKITGSALLVPTIVWTFLGSNLLAFDANTCEALEKSGIVTNYPYIVEGIFLLATIVFAVVQFRRSKDAKSKREVALAGMGVGIFLLFFFSATYIADLLINYDIWQNAYNIEIYGLFGMPLFLIFLGYLVVRYKAFDLKIFGVQALILTLLVLIGSQFFFIQRLSNGILNGVTLVMSLIFGMFLIKSVKKEVHQRERIELLAADLQKANVRLKELDQLKSEFVSIASHQIRSPITAIKGYASLIMEGSYGPIDEELKKAVDVIYQSSENMAIMVEDFLDISKIEQGSMKYAVSDFNLCDLLRETVEELRQTAEKKSLILSAKCEAAAVSIVSADRGKIKQVITNLVDNSIKYTPKGSIELSLESSENKIKVLIKDTGIGVSKEVIPTLFSKFARAKNAIQTNVTGTGLGLYVVKQIVEAHKGKVWVESEGEGKGSTFIVELPIKNQIAQK